MSLEYDAIYSDDDLLKDKNFIAMKNDIIQQFVIKSNNVMGYQKVEYKKTMKGKLQKHTGDLRKYSHELEEIVFVGAR